MPLMRRRPLLRAAAVGGGAYVAGKHRQAATEREAGQEARPEGLESQAAAPPPQPAAVPAPAPAPAAGGMTQDTIDQLKQLGELHEQGVLTDQEFDQQKAKLLGS
jgi:Short C-terminal domain